MKYFFDDPLSSKQEDPPPSADEPPSAAPTMDEPPIAASSTDDPAATSDEAPLVQIETVGRTDLGDFFAQSGVLDNKLPHHPILLFVTPAPQTVRVVLAHSADNALSYPDATQAMAQWRGQWRSDFFRFTVGDLRRALAERLVGQIRRTNEDGTPLWAKRIVALVNKRGQIRALHVFFPGKFHAGAGTDRGEHGTLLAMAREHGIPIKYVDQDTPEHRYTIERNGFDRYDVIDTHRSAERILWTTVLSRAPIERARERLWSLQSPDEEPWSDL